MRVPSEVSDNYWIYYGFDRLNESYNVGKWMLFYSKKMLDIKWAELCNAFNDNKLLGITCMKCSTAKKNDRASNNDDGVIILYCNNSENENEILDIGRNILNYIQDYSSTYIYYKTDIQTSLGTRATGMSYNWTYKLAVQSDKCLIRLITKN